MTRLFRWCLIAGAAAAAVAPIAAAASILQGKIIYEGEAAASGLKLAGWGSGSAKESSETGYAGHPASIKVTTHGYYAGARLMFEKPIDLKAELTGDEARYNFVDFKVQMPMSEPATPEAGMSGTPITRFVRVVMVFDGGEIEVASHPVALHTTATDGWFSLAVPVVSFRGLNRLKSHNLKEIRIFSDTRDEFTIGEIQVTRDDEPIDIEPLEEQVVAVNDQVEFRAVAQGGLSTLKYSWDFDKSDGIQEDATGPLVTHIFTKAKTRGAEVDDYVITLTVSDVSGAKEAAKREISITVNP